MAKAPRTTAPRTTAPRTVTAERIASVPVPSAEQWAIRASGIAVPRAALAWGSYRAADNPRKRFTVYDGSGDYHLDDNTRFALRSQSRDLERNNALYEGFLSNWTTYLIGSGPRPIFTTASEEFNKAAHALWAIDAASCVLDARRLFPWAMWCAHLARCIVRDGDAAVQHLEDGSGMLLESERITAVELDQIGRILGYTVSDPQPYGVAPYGEKGTPISAQDMSLPAWRTRPSQTRGLPAASASLDDWERLESLQEAEIISAEAASLPWMVVTHNPGSMGPVRSPAKSTSEIQGRGPATPSGWQRTDAGSILGLPPGLDGKPWSPARPNLDVPPFIKMVLSKLCLPMLPYEVSFLDLADLNYAAIRAVGKLASRKLADQRTHLIEPTISRMARDWARMQILRKRLPFTPDFANHRWDWDQLEIRDREKDATAVNREMENGTTTLQDELGPTWRETVSQTALEKREAMLKRVDLIKEAMQLAKQIGVDWRELVTLTDGSPATPAPAVASAPDGTQPPMVKESRGKLSIERDAAGRIIALNSQT